MPTASTAPPATIHACKDASVLAARLIEGVISAPGTSRKQCNEGADLLERAMGLGNEIGRALPGSDQRGSRRARTLVADVLRAKDRSSWTDSDEQLARHVVTSLRDLARRLSRELVKSGDG